ncbi:hypothetical protein [Pseudomonas gingeri]
MATVILSDNHLTALVSFALGADWHLPALHSEAQRLADCLKGQNIEAFNEANMDQPGIPESPCVLNLEQPMPDPVQALKLIELYERQVCEFGGYHYYRAAYELRAIRAQAVAALPGDDASPTTI